MGLVPRGYTQNGGLSRHQTANLWWCVQTYCANSPVFICPASEQAREGLFCSRKYL